MDCQKNVPPAMPPASTGGAGFPEAGGVTRLLLGVRDLGWMHARWEVAPYTWAEVARLFGPGAAAGGEAGLRFSMGEGAEIRRLTVHVRVEAGNWYVRFPFRPARCRAELGLLLPDGLFALLAVSKDVWMPAAPASAPPEEKWAVLNADWERLCRVRGVVGGRRSFDLGGSSGGADGGGGRPLHPKHERRRADARRAAGPW